MRNLNLLFVAGLLTATCGLAPANARSQEQAPVKSDVLIRIEGPVTVGPADTIGTVWVIGNNATVLGTVRELVVINGNARVDGTVQDNMVLVKGSGVLGPAARIGQDVLLYQSTVSSVPGYRIGGTVHNELGVSFGARALWLLWLSVTIALIAAGLVFGYFAGDSLGRLADGLRADWRGSLLTALVMLFGLPAAAILSFVTGIGFVLGFFILFVLIPFLSLAGYVVVGSSLGRAMLGGRRDPSSRMLTAIALGILVMQVIAVIPGIGGLILLVGSQIGAGALVYRTWRRGRSEQQTHPALIIQPA